MSDYNEHLISMAGGDGDPLAGIEARTEDLSVSVPMGSERLLRDDAEASLADLHTLLALVRERDAVIAKLSDWAGRNRVGYYDEAQDDVVQIIRAAITSTEATK